MLYKVLRKLKLVKGAYALLYPFRGKADVLPGTEEARALLEGVSPDAGGSCLCERRVKGDVRKGELDIIIPAYNAERYLRECMDSVLGQDTRYSFRVIVIDDGSTDETGGILDEYAARDSRVKVVHQENRGHSGARNAGLEMADAELVMFLDSDDVLFPAAVEQLAGAVLNGGAVFSEGAYEVVDTQLRHVSDRPHKAGEISEYTDCYAYPWGKAYRLRELDGFRFPEGYLYEDSFIYQVLFEHYAQLGKKAAGVGSPVVRYRVNPGGISRKSRGSVKSIDSLWITLSLHEDRKKLGIQNTQEYYEYILSMLVLTYRRTEQRDEETKKAIFAMWLDFLGREFEGFSAADPFFRRLERAVQDRDYPAYALFCKLAD